MIGFWIIVLLGKNSFSHFLIICLWSLIIASWQGILSYPACFINHIRWCAGSWGSDDQVELLSWLLCIPIFCSLAFFKRLSNYLPLKKKKIYILNMKLIVLLESLLYYVYSKNIFWTSEQIMKKFCKLHLRYCRGPKHLSSIPKEYFPEASTIPVINFIALCLHKA